MESCKLPDVPLFRGLTETEAAAAIEALRMRRRPFAKGEVLLEAGCTAPPLGVVLAGRVHMEHLDVWGSKTLLGQAGPGRSVCRDLRLPARGTAAGQRGGSRKRRGAAFGHRSTIAVRLRTVALEDDPKPAAYCCPQKPGAGPA